MKNDIWSTEVVGAIVAVAFNGRSMEERLDCIDAISDICHTVQMGCADIGEKYDVPGTVIEHIMVAAFVNAVRDGIDEKEFDKLIEMIDSLPIERIAAEKLKPMIATHESKRKFN